MTDLDEFWPPSVAVAPRRAGPARAQGRRDKALSRDEIVQAAIVLADSEGAGAVNMRRIATELCVGAMSLYWHVADKERLLDLMLDAVEGEDGTTVLSGEWREDFWRIASQRRRALLRHPWVVDFMSGRPPFGPNALLQIERSLSVLDDLDVDTRTALQILTTVDNYVTGSVLNELREIRVEHTQSGSGLTAQEITDGMKAWRDRLDRSGRFGRVLRVFDEGIDPDAAETRDERFEFGLDCVLGGVACRLSEIVP
jgi:AcrR family transcriptional regulator